VEGCSGGMGLRCADCGVADRWSGATKEGDEGTTSEARAPDGIRGPPRMVLVTTCSAVSFLH
jgi:hypothetical protein